MKEKFFNLQLFANVIELTANDDNYMNEESDTAIYALAGNDSVTAGYQVYVEETINDEMHWSLKSYGENNSVYGGAGNDTIKLNSNSFADGGENNDYIFSGGYNSEPDVDCAVIYTYYGHNNTVTGGEGDDTIRNFGDNADIKGDTGNDSIISGDPSNSYEYDNGNGFAQLYGNNSTVSGGAGDDTISNGGRHVLVSGDEGNDYIVDSYWTDGNEEHYAYEDYMLTTNSTINGGNGNDTIKAYGAYALIDGGKDNDYIENALASNSTMRGGEGNDVITLGSYTKNNLIQYASGDGNDTIFGFKAGDTLNITDGEIKNTVINNDDFIISVGNGNIVLKNVAGQPVNLLTTVNIPAWHVNGTTATYDKSSDTLITIKGLKNGTKASKLSMKENVVTFASGIIGSKGASINGGGYTYALSSAGKLVNTGKAATFKGSAKNDTLVGGRYNDSLLGDSGNDSLVGGDGNDTLSGGAGNDKLFGGSGNDSLVGGDGKDTLNGDAGNDTLFGGSGNDSLVGGDGKDTLNGGDGNDTLNGGKGNDTLTGGKGKDVFVYSKSTGNDVITDYTAGTDKIKISGTISKTSYSGNDVIFKVGSGTLTVKDGKGKKITINGSTKTYGKSTSSNVSSLWFAEENNFVSNDNLSEITESNLTPTSLEKISSTNFENLTTENNFVTYSDK